MTYLRNAPIKEAIIDIQVAKNPKLTTACFEGVHKKISQQYPYMEKITTLSSFTNIGNQGFEQKIQHGDVGFLFKNEDKNIVAQFRVDGFVLNKLPKYENWADFSSQAKELWKLYQDCTDAQNLAGISVRFINVINFSSQCNFAEYLTAPPTIPEKLPQNCREFLTSIVRARAHS